MPTKPLTPEEKTRWNKFIDFVQNQKVNPQQLDQRNKQVGMSLLQKYNFANPKDTLDMGIVPRVQQDLQDYRNDLVSKWKQDPRIIPEAKSENDIMSNISPVDGWPGSKTLTRKFPVAQMTIQTPTGTTVKNYGTDINAYDVENFPKKTN